MTPSTRGAEDMPKINVYLPDDLAEAVRSANLPVSTICQRALATALQGATSVREGTGAIVGSPGGPVLHRAVTGRLQRAIDLADGAAKERSHAFVGTEHLLLGVLDEGENLALRVLTALEVDPADVRTEVLPLLDGHEARPGSEPQRTPHANRALELAGSEAIRMGHNYLGCEHLLLGLVTEEEGLGGRVLRSMGVDATVARRAVVAALAGFVHRTGGATPAATPTAEPLEEIRSRLARIEARLGAG
jgi:ATP-dependent Clp protease ATP-binding subunit ClpC